MFKLSRGKRKRQQRKLHRTLEALETRRLLAADWQNPINPADVNSDQSAVAVTPLDALIVINEMNEPQFSDAATGRLPELTENDETPQYYVDVDADGFVSPLDALLVINELNVNEGDGAGLTSVHQASNVIAGSRAAAEDNVTSDTLVNTTTAKNQSFPAVAADPQGNIVSVWQSFHQDGSGWGVFGQRYTSDGAKVGDEFQVNTTTRGAQRNPSVAFSDDGSFMVVWQSIPDGGGWGIYGQRFGSDGVAVGGETLINSTTRGAQQNPDIAAGPDGYTVVWQGRGEGDHNGIFASTIDATGNASDEMLVNNYTRGAQGHPAVDVYSSTTNGVTTTFPVVSWNGKGPDDATGIFMRALDGTQQQVQVNQFSRGIQHQSDISVSETGDVVVVWKVFPGERSKDVMGRVFDMNGNASDEFLVNQTTRRKQFLPAVDHLSDGTFAVAWGGYGESDSFGSFLRTFNADGTASSDEMRQNFTTRGVQNRPAVAAVNQGYVVAWQGKGEGDHSGIFARLVDTEPMGPFGINTIDDVTVNEGDAVMVDADITDFDGVADAPCVLLGSERTRRCHDRRIHR